MFRLILFDIDGTLISTDGAGVKAFGRVFDEIFGLRKHPVQLLDRLTPALMGGSLKGMEWVGHLSRWTGV